jgi:hypothetical protein
MSENLLRNLDVAGGIQTEPNSLRRGHRTGRTQADPLLLRRCHSRLQDGIKVLENQLHSFLFVRMIGERQVALGQ